LSFRPSSWALALVGLSLLSVVFSMADSVALQARRAPARKASWQLAQSLGLWDLALMTEAVHTRHLSLSTVHSAFLAYPLALDASPSSSFAPHENLAR